MHLSGADMVGTAFLLAEGIGEGGSEAQFLDLRWQIGHSGPVDSVAWSPNGRCIATGSHDGAVKIWDAASGRVLNTLAAHDNRVNSVCWSPDGTRLASGSADNTVKVWDAATGRVVNTLAGHDNLVFSVAWSADGTRLASGSDDRTIRIWDAECGALVRELSLPASVQSISWSSDSRRLVLAFLGFLEIWDVVADPARPLVRLYSPSANAGLAATPDGYVFGSPEALEWVRFGNGWTLYDVTDVPERVSEERVLAALRSRER